MGQENQPGDMVFNAVLTGIIAFFVILAFGVITTMLANQYWWHKEEKNRHTEVMKAMEVEQERSFWGKDTSLIEEREDELKQGQHINDRTVPRYHVKTGIEKQTKEN